MTMMQNYRTSSAAGLRGEITIAPDKSISHRSLIFSALADGESTIRNLLLGEDVLCTLTILRQLGVRTSHDAATIRPETVLTVEGAGWQGLKTPKDVLYCGNSGTAMRLLLGLVAGANLEAAFTGDASLNRRPMERVTKPLERMGARFSTECDGDVRYIRTHAHGGLKAASYDSPVASAQVKTALVLAGLNAEGETVITEPELSRNHTEILLSAMGANLVHQGTTVRLRRTPALKPIDITVPGDISSAAFFLVGALITPNSDVLIRNVNLNPTRTGLLDVLQAMGGDIAVSNTRSQAGEPVGDVRVRTSKLKNVAVGGSLIPRLIDEIPVLSLAAAFAQGDMVVSDAKELRVKETDRIKAVCAELSKLGVEAVEKPDGLVIRGGRGLRPATDQFASYGDHRIAMTLIVAGLNVRDSLRIDDVACIKTSFPEFFGLLDSLRV